MDFEKLLRVARKNELNKKEPIKCLQTKFKPPTKEQHEKDKVLSKGVQRFLARKEEEEKRKQMEADKRRQELFALRAKDPKANKRIQTMLKRTKSANKSVMEDAIDNNNTADTLAGPSQPDEDDYGFVSESSSQLYNKLIQKMYSTPSHDLPKFAPSKKPTANNLSNTKERVKMALLRQEEEEKLPHKRKRKGKEKKEEEEEDVCLNYSAPCRNLGTAGTVDQSKDKVEKPKVKKLPMPPPVDFHELLKIAEQKQHEPIVLEPKKPLEPEMLMTKKQKIEYEKMQEWKRQRELRLQSLEKVEKGEKWNAQEDKKCAARIPKLSQSKSDQKLTSASPQKKVNGLDGSKVKGQDKSFNFTKRGENISKPVQNSYASFERKGVSQEKKSAEQETSRLFKERDEALRILKEKEELLRERDEALRILKEKEELLRERDEAVRRLREKEQLIKERDEAVRKLKLLDESEKVRNCSKPSEVSCSKSDFQELKTKTITKDSGIVKPCSVENVNVKINPALKKIPLTKNSTKPEVRTVPNGSHSREFPFKDVKSLTKLCNSRGGSRSVERSKQFPPADVRRKVALTLKRRRIESDEEYDSELNDFIDDDDTEVPSEEVSKVISEIFKYDKNKYSKYDDVDDECMESNFAQISKEEFFSTKCGILEDLKDIQREKAKLAKKKKR